MMGTDWTYAANFDPTVGLFSIREMGKEVVKYKKDRNTICLNGEDKVEVDVGRCAQEYIGKQIGCPPPWTRNSTYSAMQECFTNEVYKNYLETYKSLTHLTENELAKKTGCLPKCNRHEYTLR